ncbi:non-specific serine,threonine protein kinase [Sarracenia purpurea var. burkii]
MISRAQSTIYFVVCIVPLIAAAAQTPPKCNRSCGVGPAKHLQFPFGFSSGCPIRLNCTSNGTVVIGEFPVQTVTSDGILVSVPSKCGRPIQTLDRLFSHNYAPTSHNGILLENCSSPISGCLIPYTTVKTRFELLNCGTSNKISCYSEQNKENEFIDYQNLTRSGCRSLFSAISVDSIGNSSAVILDVQVVKLGWWLDGDCLCSANANCTEVSSPITGRQGYRCRCLEGFVGDGFRAGLGCRRASSACDATKYMSGQCNGTTRIVTLVAGVAAGASLMVSVGLICCFLRRRSKSKKTNRANRRLYEATGIHIPIYPYKDIERATNFFSDEHRLGTGAYGTVYAGKLKNDEWVAIKRIKHRDTTTSGGVDQVLNEIKLLSSVSHQNLVRLLGCSIENGAQILVYEFMPNGTLSQRLQTKKNREELPWLVRLSIAAETAQAIAYLHGKNPPIYHRDIKSSNILLDHEYKSKVADFGLSRLGMTEFESSHISTAPQGTPGYLDPQYYQNFQLSDKSDVYSFGVVLAEIITGLKAVDLSRDQNEVNLAVLAAERIGKGRVDEIIDPAMEPPRGDDGWTVLSIQKVAEVAFRCLAYDRDVRPSMAEVAAELEQVRGSRWRCEEEKVAANSAENSSSSCFSSSSNVSENPLGVS